MSTTAAQSWLAIPSDSDFPLENLPYGVFIAEGAARIGVAVGDHIFDLYAAAEASLFDGVVPREILQQRTLHDLLESGRTVWTALRRRTLQLLENETPLLSGINRDSLLVRRDDVHMVLPIHPGDYVDFYSSIEHASNLGKILRPDGEPLLPNWRWLPIGYHGRSSTIIVDGTPVVRPSGQRKPAEQSAPAFGPTRMLDIELEVGFITGPGNLIGSRIPIEQARDHIFGLVLVNDWSARDIQAWEYQPLGPFLGKSFATSISPWVVTLDALEPYRVPGPAQDPPPLPYLHTAQAWNFDIDLFVELQTWKMREAMMPPQRIVHTNFRHMYWNMAQQLAHVTVNGTAVRPGDLYASGTISGKEPDSYGSLIELTWRGTRPLRLANDETRTFLDDGDTVVLTGRAHAPGKPKIGFGRVSGTILPSV